MNELIWGAGCMILAFLAFACACGCFRTAPRRGYSMAGLRMNFRLNYGCLPSDGVLRGLVAAGHLTPSGRWTYGR